MIFKDEWYKCFESEKQKQKSSVCIWVTWEKLYGVDTVPRTAWAVETLQSENGVCVLQKWPVVHWHALSVNFQNQDIVGASEWGALALPHLRRRADEYVSSTAPWSRQRVKVGQMKVSNSSLCFDYSSHPDYNEMDEEIHHFKHAEFSQPKFSGLAFLSSIQCVMVDLS